MTEAACRWLIAGCGDLGIAVADGVRRSGGTVLALRRDPSRLPPDLPGHAVDLVSGRGLADLPRGFDVVLVCAAAGRGADEDSYRALYVDGTARLLERLSSMGESPRCVAFTSSTAVYAQTDGSIVDENSPTCPQDYRGRTMLAAEDVVRNSAGSCGLLLRLAGLYGPGRLGLAEAVRSGRAQLSADGRSPWTNRIHLDDAAAAVLHLVNSSVESPSDEARVFNVVDAHPARRDDVVRDLASRLGIEPGVGESGARTRTGDRRVSSERLLASGFELRYPDFRAGYGALLSS